MVKGTPMSRQRLIVRRLVGAAAGGLLVSAFLPIAVAFADEDGYIPDPSTLFPISEVTGFPPYSPEVVMGNESWSRFDFTTNQMLVPDQLLGPDTETIFGSFTNNDFSNGGVTVDLANFGGGWENEWIDLTGGVGAPSDLLITPFGDFPLFGTFF
jgi:hypothetical protein